MHAQPNDRPHDGIVVAHGYGLKLYVDRGHLVVHDGIGRQRNTRRYSRATSKLKRVVIIGHTGFVTLEALRWIRDIGAAFVQVGADGELIALSAPARHHESKLRRAQALAAESDQGKLAIVQMLQAKLARQAEIADRHADVKPTVRVKDATPITVGDFIRGHAKALMPVMSFRELRLTESIAGRAYWQVLARLPIRYKGSWATTVPEHWHTAGPRTSHLDRKRARLAQTPAHAILETRRGVCRLGPEIARELAGHAPALSKTLAPHAEQLARTLLKAPRHPTPLTRARHRDALASA